MLASSSVPYILIFYKILICILLLNYENRFLKIYVILYYRNGFKSPFFRENMLDTQYLDVDKISSYLIDNFKGEGHLDIKGGGHGKFLLLGIPPQERSFEIFNQDNFGYFKVNISNKGEELCLRVKKSIPLSDERSISSGKYKVRVSPQEGERNFVKRFWWMSKDALEAIPSSSLLKGNIEDYCFENKV